MGFLLLQTSAQGNPILGFLPLLLIFGIFYFLLFLPMQRQKKSQAKMLKDLKSGDVVTTSGGLIGTVLSLSDDTVVLRFRPDNVKLQVTRSAITGLVNPEESK